MKRKGGLVPLWVVLGYSGSYRCGMACRCRSSGLPVSRRSAAGVAGMACRCDSGIRCRCRGVNFVAENGLTFERAPGVAFDCDVPLHCKRRQNCPQRPRLDATVLANAFVAWPTDSILVGTIREIGEDAFFIARQAANIPCGREKRVAHSPPPKGFDSWPFSSSVFNVVRRFRCQRGGEFSFRPRRGFNCQVRFTRDLPQAIPGARVQLRQREARIGRPQSSVARRATPDGATADVLCPGQAVLPYYRLPATPDGARAACGSRGALRDDELVQLGPADKNRLAHFVFGKAEFEVCPDRVWTEV